MVEQGPFPTGQDASVPGMAPAEPTTATTVSGKEVTATYEIRKPRAMAGVMLATAALAMGMGTGGMAMYGRGAGGGKAKARAPKSQTVAHGGTTPSRLKVLARREERKQRAAKAWAALRESKLCP